MNPMEPRGGVGQYDRTSGRYTLHVSSQNIHINRDHTARAVSQSNFLKAWLMRNK